MGISYADDTITVNGGRQADPFTMADLDADGTVGQYITPGGYGLREYAVSKALVIGSDAGDTFFDLSNSIITMMRRRNVDGLYHSASRRRHGPDVR